jgi:negative regulator of sigma E activity
MHEEWTDQLSDYLDGELSGDERDAVESHLAGCAHCRNVLEELRRVIARARSIQPRPPHQDLWAGIAERIEARPTTDKVTPLHAPGAQRPLRMPSRRISFTLPQLAAAAVLLMALSGGIVWFIVSRPEGLHYNQSNASVRVPGSDGSSADVQVPAVAGSSADLQVRRDDDVQAASVTLADQQYDAAVADLEQAVHKGRGRLDASTIAIVEHNLQIIDQAMAQARQALGADPANSYLSSHLVEARRRKLDLLRRTAALTGETD